MKYYHLTFDQLSGNGVRVSSGPFFPIPGDNLWDYRNAVVAAVVEALRRVEPVTLDALPSLPLSDPDSGGRAVFEVIEHDGQFAHCFEVLPGGRGARQCTLFAPLDGTVSLFEMCAWAIARALEPDGSPAPYIHDPETGTCRPNPEAGLRKLSEFTIPHAR